MNDQSSDHAGVLIVRLWIEPNHPTALRARITRTLGNTKGEHTVAVASSGEEICTIVQAWVSAFTGAHHAAGDSRMTATGHDQPHHENPEDHDA